MAVRAGGQGIGFGVALSTDAHKVTVAPAGAWPDSVEVTVEAGPWVTDVYGRRLAAPQQTRFRTVDLSPPRVIAVTPADRSIQVDLATSVSVRFDEPLDTADELSPLVSLASGQGSVAGAVTAPTADTLLFTPEAPLVSNTAYTVTVNGARDLLGHVADHGFHVVVHDSRRGCAGAAAPEPCGLDASPSRSGRRSASESRTRCPAPTPAGRR